MFYIVVDPNDEAHLVHAFSPSDALRKAGCPKPDEEYSGFGYDWSVHEILAKEVKSEGSYVFYD